MMVERTVAVRRRGPGEVEGPQSPRPERRANHLHHIGVAALFLPHDLGGNGADVGAVTERVEAGADETRIERRQIALQIYHGMERSEGIELRHSLEYAVRPTLMIRAR